MAQITRVRLSETEQGAIWKARRAQLTSTRIADELRRSKTTIQNYVVRHGGIAPYQRRRRQDHLSSAEREEISRGVSAGESSRSIARRLARSPSSISRELARNGGRASYRAHAADQRALAQARRPKRYRLETCPMLQAYVIEHLKLRWSPEQIAATLKHDYPHDEDMRVSHETIYKSLFIQARGALKKDLVVYLRSKRSVRRPKRNPQKDTQQGSIVDGISIRERPAEVEDRAVPGHWEGDLIEGKKGTHIATLVERQSRFVILVKVANKETETVVQAVVDQMKQLPRHLLASLTWDRGAEMANHKKFTIETNAPVYFCDPSSPWQRGSNENTNRLLRDYFPKGSDLSQYSQADLEAVARELNQRPRKTLGWKTPAAAFNAVLQ